MSDPIECVPHLIYDVIADRVIADLEKLAAMGDWELQYLKRRKLWRAHSLIIELLGKTETE